MRTIKLIIFFAVIFTTQVYAQESVIILHGLAKSDRSLSKLSSYLDEAGYYTVNYDYPSTKRPIESLAHDTISKAIALCPTDEKIHFVTHSMGGILVREYLSKNTIKNLGRVVMLGPPNKGSQIIDKLINFPGFKIISGPAGMQLGTGQLSLPNKLGPANFEVGIIAGTRSVNLILSTILPKKDDGKVTVESTKIEGMSDHIALPVTHPFMMKNKKVIKQVIYFLKNGKFKKKAIIQ